ncbi:hypothetical protein CFC21_077855, partial [Triticum aestivum]
RKMCAFAWALQYINLFMINWFYHLSWPSTE